MKTQLIVRAIILVAIVSEFVQMKADNELLRTTHCFHKTLLCRNQITTTVTIEEMLGLCKANPLDTASSKCLIDCQMRLFNWMDDKGFQKNNYMAYIKNTNLGVNDRAYQRAADRAAELCKDKKATYDDSCETAYLIMQCLQDEGDKQHQINLGYVLFYVKPIFP